MNREIYIDNEKYEYVDDVTYKGKKYIAYTDNKYIYISEYTIREGKVTIKEVSDEELSQVKEVMGLWESISFIKEIVN